MRTMTDTPLSVIESVIVVTSRSFVCGLVVRDGLVVRACPVLGWAIGHSADEVVKYCQSRGWTVEFPEPKQ